MMTRETITIGRQRFRVGPWQADAGVAHLSLPPRGPAPTTAELAEVIDQVCRRGYTSVLTSAIEASETASFTTAGFAEHDRLEVLVHGLTGLDGLPADPDGVDLRRGRRQERPAALVIDQRAFPPFWRLDDQGLADAETATPSNRFRVATRKGTMVGYAVTGRGGRTGFLQRLATDPSAQHGGVGTALVRDSLRWCRRKRCTQVFVNTQVSNETALRLYNRLGFRSTAADLVVLMWTPT